MIKSPLKWAGGKTRVMPQLLKYLPKADCLIEPFVGSGTVFMNTEYRRHVLCDSNRALINFFLALRDSQEKLILVARNVFRNGNNEDSYYEERKLFNHLSWDDECADDYVVRWAASFLYLNRLDSVIYSDPPYIPTSKTANFTAYGKPFTLDDHRALVSMVLDVNRRHGTRSVISNSDTPETRETYSAFNLHAFSVRRSVSAKTRDMAGEVIGVLRVCGGCGRSGGGNCSECGQVVGLTADGVVVTSGYA